MGATAFLAKPIEAQALLTMLQSQLSLSWIYEENKTVVESTVTADSQTETPELAVLHELQALIKRGDMDAIEELGDRIKARYPTFATKMVRLAQSFQLKALKLSIQEAIDAHGE